MTDIDEREPLDLDAAAVALAEAVSALQSTAAGRVVSVDKVKAALEFMPDLIQELGKRRAFVADLEEAQPTYEFMVTWGGRQQPDSCFAYLEVPSWEMAQIIAANSGWRGKAWQRQVSTVSLRHQWQDVSPPAFWIPEN